MPISYAHYPANWKSIRARILARAMHACEGSPHYPACRAENGEPHPETGSTVVLTIAHTCHDSRCEDESHLLALCQRCHLRLDQDHHQKNAARTRLEKKQERKLK